jgi:hypothetical protein
MSCPLLVRSAVALAMMVAAAQAAPNDPGWPRDYTTGAGHQLRLYQPQIASWDGQTRLVAYVAVAHTAPGGQVPVLGTIRLEADTTIALAPRLVRLSNLTIADARFASVDRAGLRDIVADIDAVLGSSERVIALDRVLAGLDASRIRPRNLEGVKADPPHVFFSTSPAILVGFDGEPVWSPVAGTDLRFAVNTNWDVFEHAPSKTVFLRCDSFWLKAPALTGPWTPAGTLPPSFARLPADDNWATVKASLPGRRISAGETPAVFVSTKPAELLLLRGAPSYVAVGANSQLLWVHNTDSDVFRMGDNGTVYYLVAGRWFSAPGFAGPWTFATPTLPADFARISSEHPRARVLAAVPGTPQAAEAVALAQVPQTARITKASLQAPEVRYQGEPQFQAIERTSLQRAVNTDKDIILAGGRYYLCFRGVWFVALSPSGPWVVAGTVPREIYAIPVSSPIHHVTYVTIVEDAPATVVVSTAPGYGGVTIAWGCAVWGTGWYYPPYVWYGGAVPIYYPSYATYGHSAWYNPWTGAYQRGAAAYGPYGGVGVGARYDPTTGTYARGAMAWGPHGANGAAQAFNPRTGTYAETRQGAGVYGSWGTSSVQRGDDWARTARVTDNVTGATRRVTRTDDGAMVSGRGPRGSGFVAAGDEGVYAGRDGSVYRRADGGGWQRYENGTWGETQKPGDRPAAEAPARAAGDAVDGSTLGQLERDRAARRQGAERTRDFGAFRSGERAGRAGGARPAGGRRRR